jgi:hypothetical protein
MTKSHIATAFSGINQFAEVKTLDCGESRGDILSDVGPLVSKFMAGYCLSSNRRTGDHSLGTRMIQVPVRLKGLWYVEDHVDLGISEFA